MSESKHTPGPWHVSEGGFGKIHGHHPTVYATDDNLRYIATCADYASVPRTNNLANAYLIAAAPDLLAACKAALRLADTIAILYGQNLKVANWHKNGDLEPLDNFIESNTEGNEADLIRAAIAAAEQGATNANQ